MSDARQPKGVPVGGQFAATARTEPNVSIRYRHGTTAEQLVTVTAALAANEARWESEKAELKAASEERTQRRRRLSGARAAAQLLTEFPDAVSLTYTRDPDSGITSLESIEDIDEYTVYDSGDLDGPVTAGNKKTQDRRVAARQAVRQLTGTTPPPEHGNQGIALQGSDTERMHLPTALEDGLVLLEAEELTPEQSSAQRMNAALSHWSETDDDPQTTMRDLLTDLRHYAAANNLDLGDALDGSYQVFLEEHNDPAFKEGF